MPPSSSHGSKKLIVVCLVFPILCVASILLGFRGCILWYSHRTKAEIASNRAYYESLVRVIEKDDLGPSGSASYALPEIREPGVLKRLPSTDDANELYWLIKAGRAVLAKHTNGALFIRIPIYVVGESGYGAVYCSSDELPPLASERDRGECFTRVDTHWWAHEFWLGK